MPGLASLRPVIRLTISRYSSSQPHPSPSRGTYEILSGNTSHQIARVKSATAEQDVKAAWTALQRAHLLGQEGLQNFPLCIT
ncbi:MAG: DUF3703 domain-containing protein [Synechococcales cyanobacterium K44_A2020_017]|nr:DUF3703 domain-containing protein [Synechococcales cyanobacterium K32_A2020_035]MBF2093654.1 DUF3703 domain-containing protein [Synechococcales cyanobacterium K44_A2020_017]